MSDTFLTLAHQVQAFLQQSKRRFVTPEARETASPRDLFSHSQKETSATSRSQSRGISLYLEIWGVNPSRFKKLSITFLPKHIRIESLQSPQFSPIRDSPDAESIVRRRSTSPPVIMSTTIEDSLNMILQAMEGIKDRIANLETCADNIHLLQSH